MDTILITGGAGFIGGALVRRMLAQGDRRVVNLDKLTPAGNLDSLALYRRYQKAKGRPRVMRALLDEALVSA